LSAGLIALCFRLGPKHSLVSRPGPMFRPCPARCRTIWPSETGPVSLSARTPNRAPAFQTRQFPFEQSPGCVSTHLHSTHSPRPRALFVSSIRDLSDASPCSRLLMQALYATASATSLFRQRGRPYSSALLVAQTTSGTGQALLQARPLLARLP
jgi:hypothetical protein